MFILAVVAFVVLRFTVIQPVVPVEDLFDDDEFARVGGAGDRPFAQLEKPRRRDAELL